MEAPGPDWKLFTHVNAGEPADIAVSHQHDGMTMGKHNGEPIDDAVGTSATGTYRLTLRGTGGGALADVDARALGNDYSWEFTVDSAP